MSISLYDKRKQTQDILERRVTQLTILNRIGNHIASFLDQQELLQWAVDAMREELGYLQAAILLINSRESHLANEEAKLHMAVATSNFWDIIPNDYSQILGAGTIGLAAKTGETVVVRNSATDPIPFRVGKWLSPSSVSAPIKVGEKVIGVLQVEADIVDAFDENDVVVINTISDQIAVAIQNVRLYELSRKEIKERAQVQQELRESEAMYRAIIEQSHDAIYIYQGDRFLFVNERTCSLTGYKREELLNIKIWDLLHPDSREKIKHIGEERSQGKEVANSYTAKIVRKDGNILVGDFSIKIIQYNGKQAVLGVVRDITERVETEKQLRRQEQLATVGQLAGGIAHDFRNYLTTIILQSQIAQKVSSLPLSAVESLEIIISEAQLASKLVQQILDFSRHGAIEITTIDLTKFLGESAFILRQAIRENIQLQLFMEPEECLVEVDATRIQQMLVNLVTNSRDAMPDGGKLYVKLEKISFTKEEKRPIIEMPSGVWAHLSVSDTGKGISDEIHEHLFEPFFSTKGLGEGTGLGLAQVYGIVKRHKGFINVETAPGEGTTFHIYFPITEIQYQKTEDEFGTTPKGRGQTILLVEDNEQLRKAGEMVIESLGYKVFTASNGMDALEAFRSQPTDLVITDLVMPKMGGQELRANLDRLGHTKILAITGYIMQTGKNKLKKSGFLDVIEKPFNADILARVIYSSLNPD